MEKETLKYFNMKDKILEILNKYKECYQVEGLLGGVDEFQFDQVADEIERLFAIKLGTIAMNGQLKSVLDSMSKITEDKVPMHIYPECKVNMQIQGHRSWCSKYRF